MRLWSLHPSYLDPKGLVALWREGLLAQKVLRGKTKGYRNHPQLERFKAHRDPQAAIATYLNQVYLEACERGYAFDSKKLGRKRTQIKITVTRGQLNYELGWLKQKLKVRDPKFLKTIQLTGAVKPNASFKAVSGNKASWEKGV